MRVYPTRANTEARALLTESSTTTVNVIKTFSDDDWRRPVRQ